MSSLAQRSFTLMYGGGRFDASAELFPAGSSPLQEQKLSPAEIAALHQIVAQAQLMAMNLSPDAMQALGGVMKSITTMKSFAAQAFTGAPQDIRSAAAAMQGQMQAAEKLMATQSPQAQAAFAATIALLKTVVPEKTKVGQVVKLAVVRDAKGQQLSRDAKTAMKAEAGKSKGADVTPLKATRDGTPISKADGAKAEAARGAGTVTGGERAQTAAVSRVATAAAAPDAKGHAPAVQIKAAAQKGQEGKASAVVLDFSKAKASAAVAGTPRQASGEAGVVIPLKGAQAVARGPLNAPVEGKSEVKGSLAPAKGEQGASKGELNTTRPAVHGQLEAKTEARGIASQNSVAQAKAGNVSAKTTLGNSAADTSKLTAKTAPDGVITKTDTQAFRPVTETRYSATADTVTAAGVEGNVAGRAAATEARQVAVESVQKSESSQLSAAAPRNADAVSVVPDRVSIDVGQNTAKVDMPVQVQQAGEVRQVSTVPAVDLSKVTDPAATNTAVVETAGSREAVSEAAVEQGKVQLVQAASVAVATETERQNTGATGISQQQAVGMPEETVQRGANTQRQDVAVDRVDADMGRVADLRAAPAETVNEQRLVTPAVVETAKGLETVAVAAVEIIETKTVATPAISEQTVVAVTAEAPKNPEEKAAMFQAAAQEIGKLKEEEHTINKQILELRDRLGKENYKSDPEYKELLKQRTEITNAKQEEEKKVEKEKKKDPTRPACGGNCGECKATACPT